MAEGRMAEIMRKAQRLGQILVQPQRAGDHPPDLRDFEAVGQAGAVMIAIGRDEHLRLGLQPPEARSNG